MEKITSVVNLQNRFLNLGFTGPVLVMERLFHPSLFVKTKQEFLLIPRYLASRLEKIVDKSQTKSATLIGPYLVSQVPVILFDGLHFAVGVDFAKMARQHRLISGEPFQIWYTVKNNADIAFGILRFTDSNVAPAPPQAEIPENFIPDPEIPEADLSGFLPTDLYQMVNQGTEDQGSSHPEEIEDRIKVFGGTEIVFVMEKTLLKVDVQSPTTDPIEFSLPLCKIKRPFLSDTEDRHLASVNDGEGFDAFLIGPSIHPDDVEEFNIKLTKRGWESYYFQGARWKDFVETYGLAEGKKVQIWSFRRTTTHSQIGTGTSQIGFGLALVNEEQVEGSSSAQEISEEIKDRIKVFGGKKIVFVMEKTLLKLDVPSSTPSHIEFSMPVCKIENPFLSDGEDRDLVRLCHNERVDTFLIGPSTGPDDVQEFNIKLMTWGRDSFFQGADWKDFVQKYGLAEGKKVQIWSFRRTTANIDSQIGRRPSKIGFALFVVNEDRAQ